MSTGEAMTTRRAATPVSMWGATAMVYRLVLHQLATPGRIIALTALAMIAPIAGFAVGSQDPTLSDGVNAVAGLGFAVVVPVVSLVFGGAALGDLREDKTLVYIWLRPIHRAGIALGAAAAAATLAAPITIVPLVVAAVATGVGNGIVWSTAVAGVVGVVAYVSIFALFGVWLRKFIVWGLAYILIWEGFIALGGAGVARFAIRKYTRSILVDVTGADLGLAGFSVVVGIVVPLVVAAVALALTTWRLERMEVD